MRGKLLHLKMAGVLAVFLVLFMAAGLAAEEKKSGNWKYVLEGGGATVTGYVKKPTGKLAIPNKLAKQAVTAIGKGAFQNCDRLSAVTLPDSVTSIGEKAFNGCTGLTGVIIPGSVTSIGEEAFSDCISLAGVTFQEGVTAIGKGAFWACLSLTQVTLPASVSTIESNPFEHCDITSFTVAPENPVFESIDGVLFDKQRKMLVSYPRAKAGAAYAVPDGVASIGEGAFSCCYKTADLTSATIPESVTDIGDYAFFMCDITSVTLSEGLRRIGKGAFQNCGKLPSLTIPQSVTEIYTDAFLGCANLTLGVKSGYAEELAIAAGIPFIRHDEMPRNAGTDASGQASVGDRLTFGSYRGAAIEWRVLAAEENRVLVISEKILDAQPYNTKYTTVTWETSTLRQWLNHDFYNAAFTEAERARIVETTVEYADHFHTDAEAENDTLDRIFLLSVDEAEEYFAHKNALTAKPTAYANRRGGVLAYANGAGWWWLRSPGSYGGCAAYVAASGSINGIGDDVSRRDAGVRPVLWLKP